MVKASEPCVPRTHQATSEQATPSIKFTLCSCSRVILPAHSFVTEQTGGLYSPQQLEVFYAHDCNQPCTQQCHPPLYAACLLSATVTVSVCSSKGPCVLQLLGIILPKTRLQLLLFANTKLQGKDVVLFLDFKILCLLEAGNVFH